MLCSLKCGVPAKNESRLKKTNSNARVRGKSSSQKQKRSAMERERDRAPQKARPDLALPFHAVNIHVISCSFVDRFTISDAHLPMLYVFMLL